MDADDRLLTEREAAEYLCVTPVFLATMRSRSSGPTYVRLWKRKGIRYRKADLEAYVTSRRVVMGGEDGDEAQGMV